VNLWLFGGLAALIAWFLLIFIVPAGQGAVHVLLGAGLVALVVWWGRRET
jgi:hypothetical protein